MKLKIISKKADETALRNLIIIIFALAVILIILSRMMSDAGEHADDLKCRLSVLERAMNPVSSIYTSPLLCKTSRVDVGESNDKNSKEDIMHEVSELTMRCWNMFGKGALRSLVESDGFISAFQNWVAGGNLFGIHDGNSMCFVCFDVHVNSIENSEKILEPDLISYMENTIYVAQDYIRDVCAGQQITPAECEELKLRAGNNPCMLRGGTCRIGCQSDELPQPDDQWACESENEVCCVSRSEAYSYIDYIRYDGSSRGIIHYHNPGGLFEMEESQRYGVVYVEPIARDARSYIVLTNMDNLVETGCTDIR